MQNVIWMCFYLLKILLLIQVALSQYNGEHFYPLFTS